MTTNKTARAIELIDRQQNQTRTAVYQYQLALNFLLTEGGVCTDFTNLIAYNRDVILDITRNI